MRTVKLLAAAAVIIGVSSPLAACGSRQAPGGANGPAATASAAPASSGASAAPASSGPSATASSGPSATATPGAVSTPRPAVCRGARPVPPGRTLTLTASDSGKAFCVARGTGVLVYLTGTRAHMWDPVRSSSPALVPRGSGRLTLRIGVRGGSFVAAGPGTATLTSRRLPCGPQPTPTGPYSSNDLHACSVAQTFTVRVVVPA